MAVTGDQLTATVLDNGERPKSIILQLKHPLGMVEGRRFPRQRHRLECHAVSITSTIAKIGRTGVGCRMNSRTVPWKTEHQGRSPHSPCETPGIRVTAN